MRIWSVHPKYLDPAGLVAVWRETLLAKNVLEGKTKGYKHHPQLKRFRDSGFALGAINKYLYHIWVEAQSRGYNFDESKFDVTLTDAKIPVTVGQMNYERTHLLNKLHSRNKSYYNAYIGVANFEPHPLFYVVGGEVESWEIL